MRNKRIAFRLSEEEMRTLEKTRKEYERQWKEKLDISSFFRLSLRIVSSIINKEL